MMLHSHSGGGCFKSKVSFSSVCLCVSLLLIYSLDFCYFFTFLRRREWRKGCARFYGIELDVSRYKIGSVLWVYEGIYTYVWVCIRIYGYL